MSTTPAADQPKTMTMPASLIRTGDRIRASRASVIPGGGPQVHTWKVTRVSTTRLHLRNEDTPEIATVPLEDGVKLQLIEQDPADHVSYADQHLSDLRHAFRRINANPDMNIGDLLDLTHAAHVAFTHLDEWITTGNDRPTDWR